MKKKILAMLLAVVMAVGLLPTAFADDVVTTIDDVLLVAPADGDFEIDEDGVLTAYNGSGGDVTIPDGVTAIGGEAFYDCTSLTGVTIPDSVTVIGGEAFSACFNLTSVTIGNNVTTIESLAFAGCDSLTSLAIPVSVTTIGSSAFSRCSSLTEVTIPDGVTSIGDSTFNSCTGLTSVTIPNNVTSIGSAAFAYCTGLTDVNYGGSKDQWEEITIGEYNDPLLNATIHYAEDEEPTEPTEPEEPNEPETTSGVCGQNLTWTLKDGVLTISGTGDMGSYYLTGPWYDYYQEINTVIIEDGATSIGEHAFYPCENLTDVTIPASVTKIGENAFEGCESLTDVYYSGSESQWGAILSFGMWINELAFADGGQENVGLPDAVIIHYESTEPEPGPTEPETPTFSDVAEDAWYAKEVSAAVKRGLIEGDNGKFNPKDNLTRGSAFMILGRLDEKDVDTVESGSPWYQTAVEWARENDISDGNDPGGSITREQLAVMLWRYAGKPDASDSALEAFSDSSDIHNWEDFREAMAWAVENGIIQGDGGKLSPRAVADRAQAVTIVMRYCDKFDK